MYTHTHTHTHRAHPPTHTHITHTRTPPHTHIHNLMYMVSTLKFSYIHIYSNNFNHQAISLTRHWVYIIHVYFIISRAIIIAIIIMSNVNVNVADVWYTYIMLLGPACTYYNDDHYTYYYSIIKYKQYYHSYRAVQWQYNINIWKYMLLMSCHWAPLRTLYLLNLFSFGFVVW